MELINHIIKKTDGLAIKEIIRTFGWSKRVLDPLIEQGYFPERHRESSMELYELDGVRYIGAFLLDIEVNDVINGENVEINFEKRRTLIEALDGVNSSPIVEGYKILEKLQRTLPSVYCRKCGSRNYTIEATSSSYLFVKVVCSDCSHDTTVLTHCRKSGDVLTFTSENSCNKYQKIHNKKASYCGGIINKPSGKENVCMASCKHFGINSDK